MPTQDSFLRLPAVQRRVPWSRATIHRKVRCGQFPAPHRIGDRSIAWLESEINAWIAAQTAPAKSAATEAVMQ